MTVARQYSVPKKSVHKEPSWFFVVLLSGIVSGVLLFALGWYFSLPDAQRDAVLNKVMSSNDLFAKIGSFSHSRVFLVMGVDMPPQGSKDDYKQVRTDTMMLIRLDVWNKKVNIVSLPRDCKVFIPGHSGVNKLNAAFALGGPDLALATVQQTFGVNVDNYIVVNLSGVREVVDALGGIDIFVEKPMHYRDRTANLNINFQPGLHHMNGLEAEGYLRFRHDALGDIGRIRRQQQFLSAAVIKLKDPSIVLKIMPLVQASSKYLLTNMPTGDLLRTVLFAKDLKGADFQVATLPGHPSLYSQVSYWVIDSKAAEDVLNHMIIGVHGPSEGSSESDGPPSIGILYTSGYTNMLKEYTDQLTTHGFRVGCQSRVTQSATKLVVHRKQVNEQRLEEKLQQSNPMLKDVQLIYAPHGATYENNACGNTDFTVILGDDTRSAANQ